MAEGDTSRGPVVNPTLTAGAFVLPPAQADAEAEARFIRQLAEIDRAAAGPRARLSRAIAFLWKWYANLCGAALISVGGALLVTWAFLGDPDIVVALSKPQPEVAVSCRDSVVPCARAGGPIAFVQDMRRFEACQGEVVEVFTRPPRAKQTGRESIVLVQQRRPALNVAVGVFANVRQVTTIPATLAPGRWGYSWSVDSRCPGREKVDEVAAFEIEVLP